MSSRFVNSFFTLITYFLEQDGWDADMLRGYHRIDDHFGVLGSLW